MPQNKALKIARINQKCRLADLKTTVLLHHIVTCASNISRIVEEKFHTSHKQKKNVSKSENAENLRRPKKNNKGKEA